MSKLEALDLSAKEASLSVLAIMAPLVTMEMRRIANSLENILEAMYSIEINKRSEE